MFFYNINALPALEQTEGIVVFMERCEREDGCVYRLIMYVFVYVYVYVCMFSAPSSISYTVLYLVYYSGGILSNERVPCI